MVDIKDYREYWEQYKERIPGISDVVPLTIDQDISKTVQNIKKDRMVLFMLVPEAKGSGMNVDAYEEKNEAVIFLGKKYDPQRGGSYACIEEVQPVISDIRDMMMEDMASGCPVLGTLDIDSIRIVPVSTWYNVLAGWMIDFTFTAIE